jgi:hypothetical protein
LHSVICFLLTYKNNRMEFTKSDLDQLNELVFNALELDLKTDEEINKYWLMLPIGIKKSFKHWGMGDTPTRDEAYVWLQSNCI